MHGTVLALSLIHIFVARGYSVAVINPMQVKAVRKLKGLDKVKNDRVDAGLSLIHI